MRIRLKLVGSVVSISIISTFLFNSYIYHNYARRQSGRVGQIIDKELPDTARLQKSDPIPSNPIHPNTATDVPQSTSTLGALVDQNIEIEIAGNPVETLRPKEANLCPKYSSELLGTLAINSSFQPTLEQLEIIAGPRIMDGCFEPPDCVPLQKVAIVIPYKNRYEHLLTLLYHLHPILQRQKIMYCVFVAEQFDDGSFNKARVMNAAFIEITKSWNTQRDRKERPFDCFVFHDVDMLVENDFNLYMCGSMPRHLSPAIDKFNYTTGYGTKYGGVTAIRREHYAMVNGHSNRFWGWGGEDNDMEERIAKQNLTIESAYPSIGRYKMIQHDHPWWFNPMSGVGSSYRKDFLQKASKLKEDMQDRSGLTNMKYTLVNVERNSLWNKLVVDIRSLDLEKINVRFYKGEGITINNKPTYKHKVEEKGQKSARHGGGLMEPCRPTYTHFPFMTVNRTLGYDDKRYTTVYKTLDEAQKACNQLQTSCQSIVEQVKSRFSLRSTALLQENDLHYKFDVAQQTDVFEHHHSMGTYVKICPGDPHYTQIFIKPIIISGDPNKGPPARYSTQMYFRIFHISKAKYVLRSELMSSHKAAMLVKESNKLIKHSWWDSLAKIQYMKTNLVNLSDPTVVAKHAIKRTNTSTLLLITMPTSGFQRVPGCYIMKQSLYDDITKHIVMEWTWWFQMRGQTKEIDEKLLDLQLQRAVESGKQYQKMLDERRKVLELWAKQKLEEKEIKFGYKGNTLPPT